MGISRQWRASVVVGVWSQLTSLVVPTSSLRLCRSLGCTWSLAWLCQTNGRKFVSSPAVSNSLGCESATGIMEGRERCILQVCLSLIKCFFSAPDAFFFALFVKYLGNCLQLPSYMDLVEKFHEFFLASRNTFLLPFKHQFRHLLKSSAWLANSL